MGSLALIVEIRQMPLGPQALDRERFSKVRVRTPEWALSIAETPYHRTRVDTDIGDDAMQGTRYKQYLLLVLTHTQLGFLTGIAFALFYSIMGTTDRALGGSR